MIEILDTTLRDGEQTSGVSFSSNEKLSIAQSLLREVKVDRIEIGSARVSSGEFDSVKRITLWAKQTNNLSKLEVLGFIDNGISLDWIDKAGCRVMNLLCKGSLKHVIEQLGASPEEHIDAILHNLELAKKKNIRVNIYLEDWSNGMKNSPEYVYKIMDSLKETNIEHFMLPDTLGILNSEDTYSFCKEMLTRYPNLLFDFHAHNDYGLAVANVFSAIKAGIKCVHTTVNGLGERAGNAPLSSILAVLKDQIGEECSLVETKINRVSHLVESFSGIHIPFNEPVIGEHVFTQCAGIHADGDSKNNLYCNALLPERFGRVRQYALGKMSGKANICKNLEELGIDLDEKSMKQVTERIIELGDKKEVLTQEDLPYIISDVLHYDIQENQVVKIQNYSLSVTQGLKPVASVKIEINGESYQCTSPGDGQYDAFMMALKTIYSDLGKAFPLLVNYRVSIPPGGRTDAFVQTIITWNYAGVNFKTRGLDADQTEAAIKATLIMLNRIEN